MNSRRMIEIASSNGSFNGALSAFSFVRLEADNNSNNGSSENNQSQYNGMYDFNARFNPSMAIIIVVLLAAFFFMGFFSIYLRRCTTDDDGGSRYSRRRNAATDDGALHREERRGLDRSAIESFPVFSYSLVKGLKTQTKGSECTVCLNDFQDHEMLRLLPKCSHAFHPECIDMWLCSHTTCPVCRTDLLNTPPDPTDSVVLDPLPVDHVTVDVDDGQPPPVVPTEPTARDPAVGKESDELRRSRSTGHSLVRLGKEKEEKPTEWYIATPSGLTPGLHRSCSFVAMHHSRSHGPSSSGAKLVKGGGAAGDEGCSSQGAAARTRSERWGGIAAMNPSAFIRSFSERRAPPQYDQRGVVVVPSQERMAYLKRTLNWLTGRDRAEGSQRGGSRSSRRGDLSGAAAQGGDGSVGV